MPMKYIDFKRKPNFLKGCNIGLLNSLVPVLEKSFVRGYKRKFSPTRKVVLLNEWDFREWICSLSYDQGTREKL